MHCSVTWPTSTTRSRLEAAKHVVELGLERRSNGCAFAMNGHAGAARSGCTSSGVGALERPLGQLAARSGPLAVVVVDVDQQALLGARLLEQPHDRRQCHRHRLRQRLGVLMLVAVEHVDDDQRRRAHLLALIVGRAPGPRGARARPGRGRPPRARSARRAPGPRHRRGRRLAPPAPYSPRAVRGRSARSGRAPPSRAAPRAARSLGSPRAVRGRSCVRPQRVRFVPPP